MTSPVRQANHSYSSNMASEVETSEINPGAQNEAANNDLEIGHIPTGSRLAAAQNPHLPAPKPFSREDRTSTQSAVRSALGHTGSDYASVTKLYWLITNEMRKNARQGRQHAMQAQQDHLMSEAEEERKAGRARKLGAIIQASAQIAGGALSLGSVARSSSGMAKTITTASANKPTQTTANAATPLAVPKEQTPVLATSNSTATASTASAASLAENTKSGASETAKTPEQTKSIAERDIEARETSNQLKQEKIELKKKDIALRQEEDFNKKMGQWNDQLTKDLGRYQTREKAVETFNQTLTGGGSMARAVYDGDAAQHDAEKSTQRARSQKREMEYQQYNEVFSQANENSRFVMEKLEASLRTEIETQKKIQQNMA